MIISLIGLLIIMVGIPIGVGKLLEGLKKEGQHETKNKRVVAKD